MALGTSRLLAPPTSTRRVTRATRLDVRQERGTRPQHLSARIRAHRMPAGHTLLLAATATAIVLLVALIARARWHPFVALAVVSLGLGFAVGLRPADAVRAFQDGLGATLASTAGVIALGAMMGRLLALSGAAEALTTRIISLTGPARAPWAFAGAGLVVGLPVFFSVGFVLLMPLVYAAAQATAVPLLVLAMPLAAGLSAAHGLTPPHPGPLAALERLHADPGLVILYGVLAAIPAAIAAGPLLVRLLPKIVSAGGHGAWPGTRRAAGSSPWPYNARRDDQSPRAPRRPRSRCCSPCCSCSAEPRRHSGCRRAAWPRRGCRRSANRSWPCSSRCSRPRSSSGSGADSTRRRCSPRARSRSRPSRASCSWSAPAAASGACSTRPASTRPSSPSRANWPLSPIVLGWVAAVLLRVSVGSATVAITTAASLVAPIVDATPGTNRELLVVAMGAGSLALSHVNDAGFWLVKEYFNTSVTETLATWTVLETVIAVVGLAVVLLLDLWV